MKDSNIVEMTGKAAALLFTLLALPWLLPAESAGQAVSNAMLVYGQYGNYYPQYRLWTGSAWSDPTNALSAGNADINYVVVKACPVRDEYVAVTLNNNREVRAQIWRDGEWGSEQVIATVANSANRGVDVAYESLSGEAVVVSADGDADPTCYVWDGDAWSGPGTVNLSRTGTARWIKLAADPTSDELIMMAMDQNRYYTAQVWDGSNAWGNELLCYGRAVNVGYESMDVKYETSGNQGVIVNNCGTANNGLFNWCAWNGSAWSSQVSNNVLGDYMRFGRLENDPNSDNMLLAYLDNDSDIGKVFWNGSAFGAYTELETSGRSAVERCVYGIFENIAAHAGHALVCYGDTTRGRSRHAANPSSATWQAEVNAATGNYVVQACRTGDGKILGMWFAGPANTYYFSWHNGSSWSAEQVIENSSSVRSSPYKEPFMIAPQLCRRPVSLYNVGSTGRWDTVVAWATNSGGPGRRGIPASDINVFFDANSVSNCALTKPAAVNSLNTIGYTNTLSIGTNTLGVAGNLVHGGGIITIGSSAGAGLDVEGSITNAAVLTCAGASRIYCAGDWNGSAGTFNAGSSAVVLDGAAPVDTTDDGLGTVSAQVMGATPAGEDMLKAFDNNLATKWLDFATNNPVTRASWIQYRYAGGDARVVVNYTISSANDFPVRDPRDWRLLGSNNGGTSWDTLDIRTGQFFSARFETQSFSFSNSTAYNIYRLQIDSVYGPGSANSVQLSELELNEVTGHGQRVTTGGAWDPAVTNNNWKNNWSTLEVKNVSTGGVVFPDGFKAAQLVATQTFGSVLYFTPQLGVTNVYEISDSNGLKLSGGPAPSNYIKLRRYGGGVGDRWEIYPSDPGGAWAVNYVNVADSVNSASNAIMPVSYTDSGNTLNWFSPTCVALGWFRAIGRNNSVTIRWKTESEVNTAGFNLYRSSAPDGSYVKINPNFIWGLGTSSRGREYKFVDDEVVNGSTHYYKLEEVEFSGRSAWHGPVAARPGLDSDGDGMTDDWENFYGLNPALNDAALDPDGDGQTNFQEFLADTNPFIDEGEDGGGWGSAPEGVPGGDTGIYKLTVITNGIYRITAGYLENSAGVTNLGEWAMDSIKVYNQGVEIPLHVKDDGAAGFGPNDYFEFYGAGLDTRFTDANIYWLYHATNAALSGLRMAVTAGAGENPVSAVLQTARFEKNEVYQDELPDEAPDDDHWFFSDMLVATNSPSDPVDLYPVLANVSGEAGTATIRVALRAINCLSAHRIRVNLNGVDLDEGYWEGCGRYVYSAETSQTNLLEGANTLRLVLAGDTGAAFEQVLVNWVEIDYEKSLQASGNTLIFSSSEPEALYSCGGFAAGDLRVFRVASATNVAVITNAVVSGAGPFTVEFADTLAAGETNVTFAVLAPPAALVPAAIVEDASADLRSTLNGADYIIIAHDAFTNAVRPLADFRAAQGLRAKTVGIQDVYDDFSFGIATPYAIRDFMIYARANWRKPAPAFLLLAGDASYDYRDYEDMGSVNFVPAKLVHDSDSLEAPSDNWFVALDGGDDYLPDMYVGRLPARTAQEAAAMAGKIIAYEQSAPADWARKALLAADNEAQFETISAAVYDRLPAGYKDRCERIYLASNSVAACQAALTNGINAGALIAHYAGHGSIRLWADEYLFQVSDLESLTNSAALPFFVTPTCWNGYFIYPPDYDYEGLAEELLRKPDGGACACFSPSGLSVPPHQKLIVENLFRSVFDDGAFALGPAATRAKFKAHENIQDSSRNVVQIFTLFGDPAMRLKQWAGYTNEAAAPGIVLTSPLDGAENVEPLAEIRITFSAVMDDVMTRAAFSVSPQIEGALCWEGTTLVFQPEDCYSLATVYTVTINSNACDLAGNRLSCDYSFVFARTYPSGTLAIDVTPSSGSWRMASCPVSYHGALSATGGLAAAAAPEGVYVVSYGALPGYTAPCAQTQTVYRGISTAFAGVYNRHPDFTGGSVITQRYGEADLPGGIAFALHASDAEGESLVWSVKTAAAHGAASLAGSGSARIVSYRPQEGYRGTDSFALQVADPAGGTGKITVNILFNNPPAINSIPAQTVELGNALTFEVSAADPDGTVPALSMPEGPSGAAFADRGNGSGVFTWTPSAAGDLGGHTARFAASDGHLSGTTVVSIDVTSFAVTRPAAGDVARHGGDLCVAWSGARALGAVAVDLWRGTNFLLNLTNGLPAPSGHMAWHYTVPAGIRPGREYRVRVREAGNPGNAAASAPFAVLLPCPNDFDGDGVSDLSLYNREEGAWRVYGSRMGNYRMQFDPAGDEPVPWDYNGDGRTDFVVYRQQSGEWRMRMIVTGNMYLADSARLGGPGCEAAAGDYDGDGRLDVAVYQENTGQWHVLLSGAGYDPGSVLSGQFGGPGYSFVSGDYDGDGRSDPTLYQGDTGQWFGLLSGAGYALASANLGGNDCRPVSGDFDGDGRSDMAVYCEATGEWRVSLSGSGFALAALVLGGPGYAPVPGDYDGDGLTDLIVYHALTGTWSGRLSGSGYAVRTFSFGGSGYVAVAP